MLKITGQCKNTININDNLFMVKLHLFTAYLVPNLITERYFQFAPGRSGLESRNPPP